MSTKENDVIVPKIYTTKKAGVCWHIESFVNNDRPNTWVYVCTFYGKRVGTVSTYPKGYNAMKDDTFEHQTGFTSFSKAAKWIEKGLKQPAKQVASA